MRADSHDLISLPSLPSGTPPPPLGALSPALAPPYLRAAGPLGSGSASPRGPPSCVLWRRQRAPGWPPRRGLGAAVGVALRGVLGCPRPPEAGLPAPLSPTRGLRRALRRERRHGEPVLQGHGAPDSARPQPLLPVRETVGRTAVVTARSQQPPGQRSPAADLTLPRPDTTDVTEEETEAQSAARPRWVHPRLARSAARRLQKLPFLPPHAPAQPCAMWTW